MNQVIDTTSYDEVPRSAWQNFWKVTSHWLDQQEAYRRLIGGVWIKMNGTWSEAFVFRDGPTGRVLCQVLAGTWISFHESNPAIEAIQTFS